ncbi:MAG TPA: hypothetical protein VFO58_07355 [Vicinamibacterales bacterium]|nr:hypothetical protein [Vicinamibacterales bacterium]
MRTRGLAAAGIFTVLLAIDASAQAPSAPPDLAGAWAPYRGGRGADPALAPPPASPIALKQPYADQYRARRAAEEEATKKGEPLGTAASQCTPYGMPRMMSVALYPIEIIPRPEQITIITEAFSEVRRIYMNRPQVAIGEVAPGYYGHSVGRWDGDTLVVETVAIKESVLSYQGLPHSDQMRITERLRLVAKDILHDQITIADPVVLEAPLVYTLAYRRQPDYKMVEFVCENNREYIDENGRVRMRLRDK